MYILNFSRLSNNDHGSFGGSIAKSKMSKISMSVFLLCASGLVTTLQVYDVATSALGKQVSQVPLPRAPPGETWCSTCTCDMGIVLANSSNS